MAKQAIIFDLDNTIYPVSSIAKELFRSLFNLLEQSGELNGKWEEIKRELMRKPFQTVAQNHQFSKSLTQQGIHLLQNLTYDGPIAPFPDYPLTRSLLPEKYLVTAGFPALQQSKIQGLGIEDDFREIHIVDVQKSTKKEVFEGLMQRFNLRPVDLLVVGDDPESEIRAAHDLDIDAVLYDNSNQYPSTSLRKISHYSQLPAFV